MSTAGLIRNYIENIPLGQPFTPGELLSIAPRATVDKTLSRLVNAGTITRVTRGVFVRPAQSKYGPVPPSFLQVAAVKAKGAPIEVHGAEAVRRFGLSTQVQVQPVYYTTGPSRRFTMGRMPVRLKHVSARKIVAPGTNVGLAITALWYLGKDQINNQVLAQIRNKLTESEYCELRKQAPSMPAWMADAVHHFERAQGNA